MRDIEDRSRLLLIRTAQDEGDCVRFTVVDSGVGFDTQTTERLFEEFYTTKNNGISIGLSVSRSIVERFHGRLWAIRNSGPGSSFSFSIPCYPKNVEEARRLNPRKTDMDSSDFHVH
jgi:signal transduction histidine kinase